MKGGKFNLAMKDKICLVTGASAGIGKVVARELAQQGARVVLLCRNKSKAERAIREIQTKTGARTLDVLYADLSSQKQIREAARKFIDKYPRLDVLVNNAGVFVRRREITLENYEVTFAVNHLAYFLLTNLLMEPLKAAEQARVVNVASEAHRNAEMDFDDLMSFKGYNPIRAYCRSKLANIYFTYELSKRLYGSGVTANCLHPGRVATEFTRDVPLLLRYLFNLIGSSPEKGAETGLYLASAPELQGVTGKYFIKSKPEKSSAASYNQEIGRQLWERSHELTRL